MNVFLVNYELSYPKQNYFDFLSFIQRYHCVEVTRNSFAIETEETAEEVFARGKEKLLENDSLYIFSITPRAYGYGPKKVNAWLKERGY